ncbi:hypothetical protein A3A74_04910 [Candidatus Roizmanbacteria bacterium RIFCSPLOWO2_01_FULL_35_13]|uniref:Uncharacterized protein n=1 Tax=Candidatus Roizmanbacteria bacterium RIFCSPLOWO2_01_FULL_35_13 TaxID=1802055 RepID=A0A1F7IFF4_9BACT|nr:MAG: hypothetical protein A3A74_04910 [Candidatus Roizmanbacteria bacterium RIFCSPLOWO2_01_FULL_35_13]
MSLRKEFTSVTRFSKALAIILFILLPFGTYLLGLNYQNKLNRAKDKIKIEKPNITEAQILYNLNLDKDQREIKWRDQFTTKYLADFPEFKEEIESEAVVKALRMRGRAEWLVETIQKIDDSVPNPTDYGMRNYYYVSESRWKKLTTDRTLCYIENYIVLSHELNIISTTNLKEDRLILQLKCDTFGAYNGVALYNFDTLEQIKFSGSEVDENNFAKGYLLNILTSRREPVMVLDEINVHDNDYKSAKSANLSKGVSFYSIRTGELIYGINNY